MINILLSLSLALSRSLSPALPQMNPSVLRPTVSNIGTAPLARDLLLELLFLIVTKMDSTDPNRSVFGHIAGSDRALLSSIYLHANL